MKFHIVTIFPESFSSYINTSIIKRAIDKKIISIQFYNICDYGNKKTRRVDDKPFGGLPGTILSPEPLYNAIKSIKDIHGDLDIIYLSPRGSKLKQNKLEKFAKKQKDCILICGHYEGIDERIIDIFDIKSISIGEYILTSGELAAMVFLDGITRLIHGVISKESLEEESFSKKLNRKKEYPQYTRPRDFKGLSTPQELLSGDPKIIQKWKNKFI